tara:strand:- start:3349 stop:3513 length:165 start_codon:yes stop_codon:yes gene_type:complete
MVALGAPIPLALFVATMALHGAKILSGLGAATPGQRAEQARLALLGVINDHLKR